VSSATARLRAFSYGYRDSLRLTVFVHQKARSRPASSYRPSRRHVGGTGVMSYRTDEPDEFARATSALKNGTGLFGRKSAAAPVGVQMAITLNKHEPIIGDILGAEIVFSCGADPAARGPIINCGGKKDFHHCRCCRFGQLRQTVNRARVFDWIFATGGCSANGKPNSQAHA
jgi:hypothetical protein